MANDEGNDAFWAECEAEAEAFNAELARDIHQARVRAENEKRLAELDAKIAALQSRMDAYNAWKEHGSPKACQLCRSIFHASSWCPNMDQVFIANCYLEDPFYTTDLRSGRNLPDLTEVQSDSEKEMAVAPNDPPNERSNEPLCKGKKQSKNAVASNDRSNERCNEPDHNEPPNGSLGGSLQPPAPPLVVVSPRVVTPPLPFPRKMAIRDILGIGPNEDIPYFELIDREDIHTEPTHFPTEPVHVSTEPILPPLMVVSPPVLTPPLLIPKEEVSCERILEEEEELEKEPEVVAHHIPPPPLPFQVKVIPDDLEQPSFLFKYGVLAKWHIEEEGTDTSTPPPPHTECEKEIPLFVYGGEEAKEEPSKKRKRSTQEGSSTGGCSKSFGRAFAKSLRRCCLMRTQEDEWVEKWGIHSGRFKLLASPLY